MLVLLAPATGLGQVILRGLADDSQVYDRIARERAASMCCPQLCVLDGPRGNAVLHHLALDGRQ